VYQPNEQLRYAREQIPSRRVPGECLSRQDVAEFVNTWIHDTTGRRVELDENYIGKLERGVIRWPNKLYRQAIRTVLHANNDAQLGFYAPHRQMATVTEVDRQQFLRLSATVMALPWLELLTPPTPTPIPGKIGLTEIEHIRSTTAAFRSWDNTHGGGLAREAVFAQLRWSAQLLHSDCPEELRPQLFTAVAHLGSVAGYMSFDAFAHDDARRAFHFSLACAEQGGNWQLRALILSYMTRQAALCGQPDDGLTYIETALVRCERLTATERASLHATKARALAKLGRVQETLAAVGMADDEFTRANRADDPLWINFYDHTSHQGNTGEALFDISIDGRKTQSAQRLAYSVAHRASTAKPPEIPYTRGRALSQAKLASLLMATGDPRQAAAIGQQAVNAAGHLRSRRATEYLRELHRLAGRQTAIPEAVELRDRITETLAADKN
jgi:hypothetical protein